MSNLRKRLDSVEERAELRLHMALVRQAKGRTPEELSFFCIHGSWPERVGDELPPGTEFTVRGIKTIVNTQWEGELKKTTE
jgi:hypothetical protein